MKRALLGLLVLWAGAVAAQDELTREPSPERRVALTLDDLPVADSGRLSADERREVVAGLCALLQARDIPATGFFNMSGHDEQPELTAMWRDCGLSFGNHTWSHPRLREVGLAAYLADLERGHDAVRAVAGTEAVIHFRYPYLNEGFDPETRDAIRARLAVLGSPVAPVTIDTSDWLHARGYLEAVHGDDGELAERYRQAWRWNLEEATEYAEFLSRPLFGREPPQVLLLHSNLLNARHLGEYLDWLASRGYTFVSLEVALADPAYAEEDVSLSPIGESLWLRLRRSRELRARP